MCVVQGGRRPSALYWPAATGTCATDPISIFVFALRELQGFLAYLLQQVLAADVHLHSQTLALPRVTSLAVFFILFHLLFFLCLNLSKFYNSSQVVKTRKKKLNYNVTCNRRLHFPLPATSLAFDTNHVRCQWSWHYSGALQRFPLNQNKIPCKSL